MDLDETDTEVGCRDEITFCPTEEICDINFPHGLNIRSLVTMIILT